MFIEHEAVNVMALTNLLAQYDLLDRRANVPNWQQGSGVMTVERIVEQVLADKVAQRVSERARSWPEKVAVIERLRDATALGRESMRRTLRTSQGAAPTRTR